jgi:hypothetical protein
MSSTQTISRKRSTRPVSFWPDDPEEVNIEEEKSAKQASSSSSNIFMQAVLSAAESRRQAFIQIAMPHGS